MAETVTMPKLGFDMAEGTLVRWVKGVGETVAKGEVLAEIETDKATLEVDSAYEGVMARHLVVDGSVVPVGSAIALIAAPGEKVDEISSETAASVKAPKEEKAAKTLESQPVPAPAVNIPQEGPAGGRVLASPLAKSMAREKGLDLSRIQGSGPGGRILKRDLEGTPKVASRTETPATGVQPPVMAAVQPVIAGEDQLIPLSKLRTAIGRRMVEAKQTVPHFYVTHEVDAAKLLDLRKEINAELPEGEKISVNDFIVKAAALALRKFPNLNASLGENNLIRHAHVNMGIAVSVEGGLLAVVVQDADAKSLLQIASESVELVTRARQGKVKPADVEGSTFSISNLGMYAVDSFTAIINPPEAAILAVGAAKPKPVVKEGRVEPGMVMSLTLSADHRISDGVEASQFMQVLTELLENPLRLLL